MTRSEKCDFAGWESGRFALHSAFGLRLAEPHIEWCTPREFKAPNDNFNHNDDHDDDADDDGDDDGKRSNNEFWHTGACRRPQIDTLNAAAHASAVNTTTNSNNNSSGSNNTNTNTNTNTSTTTITTITTAAASTTTTTATNNHKPNTSRSSDGSSGQRRHCESRVALPVEAAHRGPES